MLNLFKKVWDNDYVRDIILFLLFCWVCYGKEHWLIKACVVWSAVSLLLLLIQMYELKTTGGIKCKHFIKEKHTLFVLIICTIMFLFMPLKLIAFSIASTLVGCFCYIVYVKFLKIKR